MGKTGLGKITQKLWNWSHKNEQKQQRFFLNHNKYRTVNTLLAFAPGVPDICPSRLFPSWTGKCGCPLAENIFIKI